MRPDLQAQAEAERLERRAALHELLHRLRGEPNLLLPFHQVLALRPKGEHPLGLRTIEVGKGAQGLLRHAPPGGRPHQGD